MEFGIGIKLIDEIIDIVTVMLERIASRYAAHGSHLERIARCIALVAAHFLEVRSRQGMIEHEEHWSSSS